MNYCVTCGQMEANHPSELCEIFNSQVHGQVLVESIAGEPMICEQHFWMLWPHDDCAGPGMPLSGANGYHDQLAALQPTWTTARPTVAQWEEHWWYRSSDVKPRIYCLRWVGGELLAVSEHYVQLVSRLDGEWAGPLAPPEGR